MRNHLTIIFCFFLTSCISVKVPLGPADKVKDLQFVAPPLPFYDLNSETSDSSWMSAKTGNTISVLSECKESKFTTQEVALDTARGIDNHSILKSETQKFQKFTGHQVLLVGLIENTKVKMLIHTFKTADCFVTLTYGGLEKNFNSELTFYNQFTSSLVIK